MPPQMKEGKVHMALYKPWSNLVHLGYPDILKTENFFHP